MTGFFRQIARRLTGPPPSPTFDLRDRNAVDAILVAHRHSPLPTGLPESPSDHDLTLALLVGIMTPSMAERFPQGITRGTYFDWACDQPEFQPYSERIRAIVASHPGERVKRLYEVRSDLREVFPFAMTPHADRGRFLAWTIEHGAPEYGLRLEEVLWALLERDESPDRGLAPTYLLRPDWQRAIPNALTRKGWKPFLTFLRDQYGLCGPWVDATKPPESITSDMATILDQSTSSTEPRRVNGVNLIAHFRYPSGLQEAALSVRAGLMNRGTPISCRDLPVGFSCDWSDRERYQGLEVYDISVITAAVNTYPDEWYPRAGLDLRPGVYRIANWYWELDRLPEEWLPRLGWANEVWAPTRFLAETYAKAVSVPVIPMLPGLRLGSFTPRDRSHFTLPSDRFLILFAFDMASVMERKNPLGLIEAFRQAFTHDEPVHLAIKVSRGSHDPAALVRLMQAADDPRITIIDRVMPRDELLALMNSCDLYASLHRSEGLGLGMAEAMLLGKPVVATGYSGNVDFMTPEVSRLVDYRMIPIERSHAHYPRGASWADPSLEHAASHLRALWRDRDLARSLGQAGRDHVAGALSLEAAADRMISRLHLVPPPWTFR